MDWQEQLTQIVIENKNNDDEYWGEKCRRIFQQASCPPCRRDVGDKQALRDVIELTKEGVRNLLRLLTKDGELTEDEKAEMLAELHNIQEVLLAAKKLASLGVLFKEI